MDRTCHDKLKIQCEYKVGGYHMTSFKLPTVSDSDEISKNLQATS